MTEESKDPHAFFEPELEIADDRNVDRFGIKKIYLDLIGGEKYEMLTHVHPESDKRFHSNIMFEINTDGSFKIKKPYTRINIYTSSHYDQNKIRTRLDHTRLAAEGFMLEPNDYKNIEATVYMKVNRLDENAKLVFSARGGRHNDTEIPGACEGSAYKINLDLTNGKVEFIKEQRHGSYAKALGNQRHVGKVIGEWIGLKTAVYNLSSGAVKLEAIMDSDNSNSWSEIDGVIDEGGWGNKGTECGGNPDQIITWGGPKVKFEWYNIVDADIKFLSVREIGVLDI